MNFYQERIRKQVERSKQEAADKAAKEYEKIPDRSVPDIT